MMSAGIFAVAARAAFSASVIWSIGTGVTCNERPVPWLLTVGDAVLVMGARDPGLPELARSCLDGLG